MKLHEMLDAEGLTPSEVEDVLHVVEQWLYDKLVTHERHKATGHTVRDLMREVQGERRSLNA